MLFSYIRRLNSGVSSVSFVQWGAAARVAVAVAISAAIWVVLWQLL
jgi:hypothetical protein